MNASFIIPVYNHLECTLACIRSLRETVTIKNYEVIVVNDCSDEETTTGLRELELENLVLLENEENRGYACSNNRGAFEAKGEILFFLNNDLILKENWFDPMLAAFRAKPKLGLVGNIQLNAKSLEIDHAGGVATSDAKLIHKTSVNKGTIIDPPYSKFKFVTAACCAIRRDLFNRMGGFDESFVNGCEDIDLCFRLGKVGRDIYVANKSVVLHHVSATRNPNNLNQEKNYRLLQRKWYDRIVDISALNWSNQYMHKVFKEPANFDWKMIQQALPRWLTIKKGASEYGKKFAKSELERNERHWNSIIDKLTDDEIKRQGSLKHANWLKSGFSYEGFNINPQGADGVWIRETATLTLPSGISLSEFSIRGTVRSALPEQPEAQGKLGLRIKVNNAEIKSYFPIPEGDFEVTFDNPPISIEVENSIAFELLGTQRSNTYAYLGRKLKDVFLIPKPIRQRLGSYRQQRHNRRLSIYSFNTGNEEVLNFKRNPTSPLNFGYAQRYGNFGINLVGWFKAELGIGESARLAAKVLKNSNIEHSIVPLKVNCLASQGDSTYDHEFATENPYSINVFHIDAPQSPDIDHYHGAKFRKNKHNIGYWAWELPEFPDSWLRHFKYFDEIWAPSDFVRDAILMKSPIPVLTMPHCIQFPVPEGNYREILGLPRDKFLFCFAYDLNSYQERKNPKAAIEAFKAAFSGTDLESEVGLVLKVHSTKNNQESHQALVDSLEGVSNYHLIEKTLSREMVYGLMNACDSYISMHRSEGFGLTVAESMFLGKPVISTNWSATAEFLNESNGCPVDYKLVELESNFGPYQKGQIWAEPSIESAASYMRRLVIDADFAKKIGMEAHSSIKGHFSPNRIAERYEQRLKAIAMWNS